MSSRTYILLLPLAFGFITSCGGRKKPAEVEKLNRDYRIAYNYLEEADPAGYDNTEIYIMDADGSDSKRLTDNPGRDYVMYSCGGKIYFLSDRDTSYGITFLYEMDEEGNNLRRVSQFPVRDSYFNSRYQCGEFIVAAKLEKKTDLYIINTQGEIVRKVTTDSLRGNDAVFSPDGSQIALRSWRSGIDEIWVMQEDGSQLRQLSVYPSEDTTRAPWHAIGTQWEANQNIITYISAQKGNYSIFAIRPDGSGFRQLTGDDMDEFWHSWSQDGEWLVYEANYPGSDNSDIYIQQADSKGKRQLTQTPGKEMGPVFVARYE